MLGDRCGGGGSPKQSTMKVEYDPEVDALHIRIQEKYVAKTKEMTPFGVRDRRPEVTHS
jgi:hypothetical protein